MELVPFCEAFAREFNTERFDVDVSYRRGRVAVITVTCRGCGRFVSESVAALEVKAYYPDGLVNRAHRTEDALKYECECWRRVGQWTVTMHPSENISFPKSSKRKKPIKPVAKVKRKIW